eukprot:1099032-Alexandrium_andersonii.AAC.1
MPRGGPPRAPARPSAGAPVARHDRAAGPPRAQQARTDGAAAAGLEKKCEAAARARGADARSERRPSPATAG